MKQVKTMLLITFTLLWLPPPGHADEDFYGTVQQIPESSVGTWVIGGRKVTVRQQTELKEDKGQIRIGTCVEVEYEGNIAEEIEREAIDKCDVIL